MSVEQLMEETHEHYEQKMHHLHEQIQQLKNRCITLQKENKHLRRTNNELIREKRKQKDQQRYKNNRRGKR